ncbi:MAG: hypothetical protein ABIJ65_03655 [Chloroflexota bacterium]
MIKAELTVGTCYGEVLISVEVTGVGPRPGTVWVHALDGLKPFCQFSHGGPTQDSSSLVWIQQLRDICIASELAGMESEPFLLPLDTQGVEVAG